MSSLQVLRKGEQMRQSMWKPGIESIGWHPYQNGMPKDDMELRKDSSWLIGLMIDYFYQPDYVDLLPSKRLAESPGEELVEPETFEVQSVKYDQILARDEAPPETIEKSLLPWARGTYGRMHRWWRLEVSTGHEVQYQKLRLKDKGIDGEIARPPVNTLIYALADKFGIEDPNIRAKTKFAEAAAQDWESQAFVCAAELAFSITPGFE